MSGGAGFPQCARIRVYKAGNIRETALFGAWAIIVQAPDEEARAFDSRFGFRPFSDREPLMPIPRLSELKAVLHVCT